MRPRYVLALLLLAAGLALLWLAPWQAGRRRPASRTLVLVTIDTLRRDRVGAYGGRASLTPRLDRLAAQGALFEDARSPVPLTLPAHTTMLAGLPPAVTGVRVNASGRVPPPAGRDYALLAETLRAAGWHTGAFVSASPLRAGYGLDQGFEVYDDEGVAEDEGGLAYAERPGEETVRRALAWVGLQGSQPRIFLWVHLFEPHAPYAPEAPPSVSQVGRYDLDVAKADALVGRLVDGLAAADRGDFAALVAADHGEALDDLGERTHGLLLGDAVLRVPLLLRAPGRVPAGRRADPADLADVAPTLLELAGLDAPPAGLAPGTGRSLLGAAAPAGRIRVAESLYAHHLHGWAQLLAAIAPDGATLVDVGTGRLHWLEPAPLFEPQAGPQTVGQRPGLAALGATLRAYRQGERPERITAGGVAAGYGHAGQVQPFLPPAENAALVDPYAAIDRHFALDQLKQRLMAGVPPAEVRRGLLRLQELDRRDPEVAYWVGRAWMAAADQGAPSALEQAEAAFGQAWSLGRQDAGTLALFAGVNAPGREAQMLDRIDQLGSALPPDCQLLVLQIRLLRKTGRPADGERADRLCEEARRICRSARERRLLEAPETCR